MLVLQGSLNGITDLHHACTCTCLYDLYFRYCLLADYEAYMKAQDAVSEVYKVCVLLQVAVYCQIRILEYAF